MFAVTVSFPEVCVNTGQLGIIADTLLLLTHRRKLQPFGTALPGIVNVTDGDGPVGVVWLSLYPNGP